MAHIERPYIQNKVLSKLNNKKTNMQFKRQAKDLKKYFTKKKKKIWLANKDIKM